MLKRLFKRAATGKKSCANIFKYRDRETDNLLASGLARLCAGDSGVDCLISPRREEILRSLNNYIAEIEAYNPMLSLVGAHDRETLITRHILDSLSPLSVLIQYASPLIAASSIADVGSGAGLPGIPLAVVMPDLRFTLIERMTRRARFLRNTLKVLKLDNVSVEEAEMEKVPPGRFTLVTFRAFSVLEPKIFKKLFRLCANGGTLTAYKGRRAKIEAEIAMLEKTRPDLRGRWKLYPCPVPFLDEERHLLVLGNT